ncbi:TetR family transcriptional regulator [Actinomadura barringtoniae]|uniref:TetR family transcriptional regulator n=1 Tax=Actinomadura barringtoniae TaxID=1427535 RepID=A0A939T4N8_9ACTN|nr:TetR family transcriptional regulator [Actinomadura barringtoniae]MBO2448494.1 TetR family transcriptional regulator [Actinomadura barringtoniae]
MPYDSSATKERILEAATTEFAEYGFAGARVDRIAKDAEANKRAIYDYFGDKRALFGAVLERQMRVVAEAVPVDGKDMAGYATGLVDYHLAHPEHWRLLMWEALELGSGEVPDEAVRTAHYGDKVRALGEAGAADASELDARELLFFTLGVVNWGFVVPQIRRMVLGGELSPEQLRDAVSKAVQALAGK